MCAIYINPVILFLTFAICFSSLLIGHASRGGFVARGARSERGKKILVAAVYREGGNRGKLVSVFEGGGSK